MFVWRCAPLRPVSAQAQGLADRVGQEGLLLAVQLLLRRGWMPPSRHAAIAAVSRRPGVPRHHGGADLGDAARRNNSASDAAVAAYRGVAANRCALAGKSFEDSLTKRQYARGTIRTCVCSSFWDVATKEAHHPGAADHQAGHRTGKRQRVRGQRGSGHCCAEVRRAPYRHRSCQFADQFRHRLRPQLRSETDVVPSRVPGVSATSHIFSQLLAIRGRRRDRPSLSQDPQAVSMIWYTL
jgi:hypothetical protein